MSEFDNEVKNNDEVVADIEDMKEYNEEIKKAMLSYISDKYALTQTMPLYRFDEYEYIESRNAYLPKMKDKKFIVDEIITTSITGHELAVSLYNLASELDELPDYTQDAELIIKWCKDNVHPYGFDIIAKSLNEYNGKPYCDINIIRDVLQVNIGHFRIKLVEFYKAFKFYLCIRDLENEEGEGMLAFGYKKKRFDILPYLEPFRDYMKLLVPNDGITQKQLNEFEKMTATEQSEHFFEYYHFVDVLDDDDEIIYITHKEENPDFFLSYPMDHLDLIYEMYLENIKEATFKVVYDKTLQKPVLKTEYNDVFDIAWDVLRKIITNTHTVNKFVNGKLIAETPILLQCPYCNDYYIKTGKNQKCCLDKACLREKERLEKRAKRAAKKTNKNTTNPNQD